MTYPNPSLPRSFFRDALDWRHSVTRYLIGRMLVMTAFAALVNLVFRFLPWIPPETSPVQYTGGVLALLLVLRTNAGYERWWEGRKLWGGIVNQSRNLAIKALAYGPTDARFREDVVRWTAAFCHAARRSLRDQREAPELAALLGPEGHSAVIGAEHMPSFVLTRIAEQLRDVRARGELDGWAFQEIDRERAALLDHIGGCERILKTPLPLVHTIKIRRFILLYLLALPIVLASVSFWLAPLITALVAYPLLAIDQIGQELENPFSERRLSHLPLDTICKTIESNLMAMLLPQSANPHSGTGAPS